MFYACHSHTASAKKELQLGREIESLSEGVDGLSNVPELRAAIVPSQRKKSTHSRHRQILIGWHENQASR